MDNGQTPQQPDTAPTSLARALGADAQHPRFLDELQIAAEHWAVYCLRTHRGACLTAGLGVSAALVDYLADVQALVDA